MSMVILWITGMTSPNLAAQVVRDGGLLLIDRDTLDVGTVVVGSCTVSDTLLAIANQGTDTLHLPGPLIVGPQSGDFSVTGPQFPYALPRNRFFRPSIRFCPKAPGLRSALLIFATDGGTDTVLLTGHGGALPLLRSDTLDFGVVPVDSCRRIDTLISNGTTGTLSLLELIGSESTQFTTLAVIPDSGILLAPKGRFPVGFTFCPKGRGTFSAAFTLITDSGEYRFLLRGQGGIPMLDVGSSELDFGTVIIGDFSDRKVELTNSGDLPIEGLLTLGSPGFALQPPLPDSVHIAPGGSQSVTIRFTPSAPVPYGGFLVISSNSSGGARTVGLRGVGRPLPIGHRIWLDTISARAGEQTHLHLLIAPPLTPIDSATDIVIRLHYDPSALWLTGASIVATGNQAVRPLVSRPGDSSIGIYAGPPGFSLEGSELMRIDLVGLSTGFDLNRVTIDSVQLGGAVIDSVDNGLVLLQGCSRRALPTFSRRATIEAISIDGLTDEAEVRYHGPQGSSGTIRLANSAGEMVETIHLPPCSGAADVARLLLRGLPNGIYFMELAIAEDRSVIPIRRGR